MKILNSILEPINLDLWLLCHYKRLKMERRKFLRSYSRKLKVFIPFKRTVYEVEFEHF